MKLSIWIVADLDVRVGARPGAATRPTLTEDGFVDPPLFRAVARYWIGHDRSLARYLGSLERHAASLPADAAAARGAS